MKKKLIALAVAVAMAAAVGCGATKTAEGGEQERLAVKQVYEEFDALYKVIIDKETGVEYLLFDGYKAGGLVVLLNPDGTPKIAEGYAERMIADEQ